MSQLALPLLDGEPPVHRASQRWREGRATYRVPDQVIVPAHYEVAMIDDDATAKAFVLAEHYSASYPAARVRFGLYCKGHLAGVAVFGHPVHDRVLTSIFPGPATSSLELSRFVLLDHVESNGETWFLARCFAELRRRDFVGVVSFSDPVPRHDADGELVFRGHIGTIYAAFNGTYLGRATPRTLRLLLDGTVFSDRAIQKIRAEERGWHYAVSILVRHGAEPPRGDLAAWLALWLPRITRRLRHPGNHRYAWALHRRHRRFVIGGRPYPKQLDRAQPVP